MERRNFLKYFAVSVGSVILGGSAVYRFYCAGGCTGCENVTRHIDPEHLEKAYQLGLSI